MLVRSLATLAGSALIAGCSVVGVRAGTEQPKYEIVETLSDGVEIRSYGERTAAQVTVDRGRRSANENSAFGMLAGYIFGNNQGRSKIAMASPVATSQRSEKIAMTSPVATSGSGSEMTMQFFLPSEYSVDTAPIPTERRVNIVTVPPETIATLRFSGMRTTGNVETYTSQLLALLNDTEWQPVGEPTAFFYDPPWTVPQLRRNEIAIPVARSEG